MDRILGAEGGNTTRYIERLCSCFHLQPLTCSFGAFFLISLVCWQQHRLSKGARKAHCLVFY